MGSVWSFGERTLQKWAKICFFLLARVHETIIIQKNQVHQALFALGDFFNVTLPSDYEKTGQVHT